MNDIINTFLVSSIPAIITGIISYLTTNKKAKTQIASLVENNKHDIEKLMKQHQIDIEALKEKSQLEADKSEQEHRHKIQVMELEHRNALEINEKEQSNAAMYGVLSEVLKKPQLLQEFVEIAKNPAFKKK